MGQWGEVPEKAAGWICTDIVKKHLQSPSLLCILPWQDWLSIDEKLRYPDANAERINIPANAHHCWCYRMHLTLEELMGKKDFNKRIVEMIDETGRN